MKKTTATSCVLLSGLSLKNTVSKRETLAVSLAKSGGHATHEGAETQTFRLVQKREQMRGEGIVHCSVCACVRVFVLSRRSPLPTPDLEQAITSELVILKLSWPQG